MYYQKKLVSVSRLEKEIAIFNKQVQERSPKIKKGIRFHKILYKLNKLDTQEKKLAFLKEKARKKPWEGSKYNYSKLRIVKHSLTDNKCCVCGDKANCMHHVKPLINGGSNKFSNLVPICNSCHEKIHPFMKQKKEKQKALKKFIEKNPPYKMPEIYNQGE